MVVSAGTSDPPSSRMLADRIAAQTIKHLNGMGQEDRVSVIEPQPLATSIAHAIVSGIPSEELTAVIQRLAGADVVLAATSIFSVPEDWAETSLNERINRAATELTARVASDISAIITSNAWSRYRHTFNGKARPEETDHVFADAGLGINFDSDLMRLAAGGTLPVRVQVEPQGGPRSRKRTHPKAQGLFVRAKVLR